MKLLILWLLSATDWNATRYSGTFANAPDPDSSEIRIMRVNVVVGPGVAATAFKYLPGV